MIRAVPTGKFQMRYLEKTYRIDRKTTSQLIYLPNACEAYSRNTYIPGTIKLMNNDPT